MKLYKNKDVETHSDDRGDLKVLLPEDAVIKSVLLCTGKKGSVRGSHWHKKDTHYCYVTKGKISYEYMSYKKFIVILKPGDMVFTPIKEKHKFVFLEDGEFIAMATEPRSQESYEEDITREEF